MQRTLRRSCRHCPKRRWKSSTDRLRSSGCSGRKNLSNKKHGSGAVRNEPADDHGVGRDHKCKLASIALQRPTTTPALPSALRTVCATWSNRSNLLIRLAWTCLESRTPPSGVPRFRADGHSRSGGGGGIALQRNACRRRQRAYQEGVLHHEWRI